MTSVDTRYVTTLPSTSGSDCTNTATGSGAQIGRTTGRAPSHIDWFSPAQAAEHRSITVAAGTSASSMATLDTLTREILSHISEYTPG